MEAEFGDCAFGLAYISSGERVEDVRGCLPAVCGTGTKRHEKKSPVETIGFSMDVGAVLISKKIYAKR